MCSYNPRVHVLPMIRTEFPHFQNFDGCCTFLETSTLLRCVSLMLSFGLNVWRLVFMIRSSENQTNKVKSRMQILFGISVYHSVNMARLSLRSMVKGIFWAKLGLFVLIILQISLHQKFWKLVNHTNLDTLRPIACMW